MPKKIKMCRKCGRYTLSAECPECGGPTSTPHPPKFSPIDKHQKYRIPLFKSKFAERNPRIDIL